LPSLRELGPSGRGEHHAAPPPIIGASHQRDVLDDERHGR
jgi:hypothetical protein